jgi:predicted permease
MESLLQDVRFAVRMLVKAPGFAVSVVLALALGIGANTAIFSVVDSVLLRPLPFRDSARLVSVWETRPNRPEMRGAFSVPIFQSLADETSSFDGLAAFHDLSLVRTGAGEPERLNAARASGGIFDLLGVEAALGRTMHADDTATVVLGDGYWKRAFGGDPAVVGRTMTLDGKPYEIAGVLPERFTFPLRSDPFDVWIPLVPNADELDQRGMRFLSLVGRLRPDATIERAQSDLASAMAHLDTLYPDTIAGRSAGVATMHDEVVANARPSLYILLGAVGFVLLIACANVANLLLARSTVRRREVAVRVSVGATRWRLVRQFLTESVIIALFGSALGLLFAFWGLDLLVGLAGTSGLPRVGEIGLDLRVLGFTVAVAVGTGLLFGLVPALHASRVDLNEALKEASLATSGGVGRQRSRAVFVVAQIALAFVLLVGAGLSLRSLASLLATDPGIDPENLLTMSISLPEYAYEEPEQMRAFYRELRESLSTLPSVESVATIFPVPFGSSDMSLSLSVDGRPAPKAGNRISSSFRAISPGYFETMGIPVKSGRAFDERDRENAPSVMVVNETFARTVFPDEDPIGKRVTIGYDDQSCEIVGVVGDVRFAGLDATPLMEMYTPYEQTPWPLMSVVVRTTSDPTAVASGVRSRVQAIDPDLPLFDVVPMTDRLAGTLVSRRLQAILLGLFAAVALSLASLGIYSVLSFAVAHRTHEIGIRVAVGASRGDVIALVLKQGAWLALFGLGLGLLGALALASVMSSVVVGVSATDPLAYAIVAAALFCVAAVASYIPARRAARIDPIAALRHE